MTAAPPTVVLVPGGFLGPWVWEPVATKLRAGGLDAVTVELASVPMSDDTPAGDLYADAAVVRNVLDALEAPVVVCGHSYGGAVITQAAAGPHPAVQRLVYLAAAAPDRGQSLADLEPQPAQTERPAEDPSEAEPVELRPDGTIRLVADGAAAALFNDCEPQSTKLSRVGP